MFRPISRFSVTRLRYGGLEPHSTCRGTTSAPTSAAAENAVSPRDFESPSTLINNKDKDESGFSGHPQFAKQSKRRVLSSPTLPLEAVAISEPIQREISSYVKSLGLRPKHLKKSSLRLQMTRSPDTYREEIEPRSGIPVPTPPPIYDKNGVASFASIRFPGTFTSNVHVLSEVRRVLPHFSPSAILDFGSGMGTTLLAATRVMTSPFLTEHSKLAPHHTDKNLQRCVPHMPIKHAWLIEHEPDMQAIASSLLRTDHNIIDNVDILHSKTLSEGPPKHRLYDLVCASYSFNEFVRSTLTKPKREISMLHEDESPVPHIVKQKAAETRLRKLVRSLWRRTAPGGVFVVIEDGTAAGFETVLFAREALLSKFGAQVGNPQTDTPGKELRIEEQHALDGELESRSHPRIIAPCIHSKKCPLDGSVTRHRICRFVQRLNRPPFQRVALPKHNAFEDEYFSYIAIQKVGVSDDVDADNVHGNQWGRIIRAPLRRPKHIALDACTKEGQLERRVVSKGTAEKGYFSWARRSKWGDIWPVLPSTRGSSVNF